MNYTVLGDNFAQIVNISLKKGEEINIERGSMIYMTDVEIEGKMNSNGKKGLGGVFSAIGRSLVSGESFFITKVLGLLDTGKIGIAPNIPGKIKRLVIDESHQYRLNDGAFLACDSSVSYEIKTQSLGKALFGGTGGLFVMETSGQGDLLINSFGDMVEIKIDENHPITIDNDHVIAWDKSLDYSIEVASGVIGFTTGEGLVNKFRGNGSIFIQTRNIRNFANYIYNFMPRSNKN